MRTVAGEPVLVIDDSPTILKVVQLVLTKAGFTVADRRRRRRGHRAARERERPDLILLDFVMPKMNGYQVCRALAESAELKDVPVVLMSAKGDQVGERFVKVMGIVDYITKPFSPEAITAVVQHTIDKYGRARRRAARRPPERPRRGADAAGRPSPRATPAPALADAPLDALAAARGLADALHGDDLDARRCAPARRRAARALLDAARALDATRRRARRRPARCRSPRCWRCSQQRSRACSRSRARRRRQARVDIVLPAGQGRAGAADGLAEEFLLGRFLVEVVDDVARRISTSSCRAARRRPRPASPSASSWSSSATSPTPSSRRRWRASRASASTSSCAGRPAASASPPRASCRRSARRRRARRSTSTAS